MKNYQKIVLASAWYDLLLTAPFAFPFSQQAMIDLLSFLHKQMNLTGNIPLFLPEHQQFVSLLGSIVIVWSILRILNPLAILGLYDSFGRFLFSFWFIYYPFWLGASYVSIIFFVPEIIWGIVQFLAYWRIYGNLNLKMKLTN